MASENIHSSNNYVNELMKEKKSLANKNSHAFKLLQKEIDRVAGETGDEFQRKDGHLSIHKMEQVRVKAKIHIPIDEFPKFNFVGKLLGPKGSSLQQLQEATQTRMAILGRGSMRDKKKEEEFRSNGDPKYSHLNEDLHLEVVAFAPAPEAYKRLSMACADIQRFLVPDASNPFDNNQEYFEGPPQFEGKQKPYPGEGPPHMQPRGGPPMGGPRPMGPPILQGREPPRRPAMVQSTYAAPEADEWSSPRPAPPPQRRGGYNAATPPARPARQTFEEPGNDFNNYGDGYGEYNSGNNASYYNYAAEPEPAYADGFGDNVHGPMRSAGGARGGRNNVGGRPQAHPYSGATRRGY